MMTTTHNFFTDKSSAQRDSVPPTFIYIATEAPIYFAHRTGRVHLDRQEHRGTYSRRTCTCSFPFRTIRSYWAGNDEVEKLLRHGEGWLERLRREPLRHVPECVFGVLALESEPVDPRLCWRLVVEHERHHHVDLILRDPAVGTTDVLLLDPRAADVPSRRAALFTTASSIGRPST
jgi:PNKP adenylyltransferase domain, C-terminal region